MAAERISEPADVASGVHANGALAGRCCFASRGSIDRAAQDRDRLLARPSIRGRKSAINGWLRVIHLTALTRIEGLLLLHHLQLLQMPAERRRRRRPSVLTYTEGTGRRSSLARMTSAGLVQTN